MSSANMLKMQRIKKRATASGVCWASSARASSASDSATARLTLAWLRVGSSERGSVQMVRSVASFCSSSVFR